MSTSQIVAHNLPAMRRLAGLSQQEVAERAGITRGMVAAIETARYRSINSATLDKLAAALGISVAGLVTEWQDDGRGDGDEMRTI